MITDWETLANALRTEVQEYGGLLNLFGQQQEAILSRDPDLVLAVTAMLERQVQTIEECCKEREAWVKDLAALHLMSADTPLQDLLPLFPTPVQLLLSALIDEVNSLVMRTKRRARQNQMLLSRSIDISQQILHRLNPGAIVRTYSPSGHPSIEVAEAARSIATT